MLGFRVIVFDFNGVNLLRVFNKVVLYICKRELRLGVLFNNFEWCIVLLSLLILRFLNFLEIIVLCVLSGFLRFRL